MSIAAVYVAFEPDYIGNAMKAVRELKMGGGTITKPFKQSVMEYLDEIDDDAAAMECFVVGTPIGSAQSERFKHRPGSKANALPCSEPAATLGRWPLAWCQRSSRQQSSIELSPRHLAVPTLEWLAGTRPSLSLIMDRFA